MFIQAEGYIHCCDWRNNSQDMNRMNSRNVLYRDDININMVLILLLLLLLLLDIGISHTSKPNASRHHQLPTVQTSRPSRHKPAAQTTRNKTPVRSYYQPGSYFGALFRPTPQAVPPTAARPTCSPNSASIKKPFRRQKNLPLAPAGCGIYRLSSNSFAFSAAKKRQITCLLVAATTFSTRTGYMAHLSTNCILPPIVH